MRDAAAAVRVGAESGRAGAHHRALDHRGGVRHPLEPDPCEGEPRAARPERQRPGFRRTAAARSSCLPRSQRGARRQNPARTSPSSAEGPSSIPHRHARAPPERSCRRTRRGRQLDVGLCARADRPASAHEPLLRRSRRDHCRCVGPRVVPTCAAGSCPDPAQLAAVSEHTRAGWRSARPHRRRSTWATPSSSGGSATRTAPSTRRADRDAGRPAPTDHPAATASRAAQPAHA